MVSWISLHFMQVSERGKKKKHIGNMGNFFFRVLGCPPLKGEKWAANKWIQQRPNKVGELPYTTWTDAELFGDTHR
jgi:hypothetical protein